MAMQFDRNTLMQLNRLLPTYHLDGNLALFGQKDNLSMIIGKVAIFIFRFPLEIALSLTVVATAWNLSVLAPMAFAVMVVPTALTYYDERYQTGIVRNSFVKVFAIQRFLRSKLPLKKEGSLIEVEKQKEGFSVESICNKLLPSYYLNTKFAHFKKNPQFLAKVGSALLFLPRVAVEYALIATAAYFLSVSAFIARIGYTAVLIPTAIRLYDEKMERSTPRNLYTRVFNLQRILFPDEAYPKLSESTNIEQPEKKSYRLLEAEVNPFLF